MSNNKLRIALIPARAGSKRLPGKNTLPLGGKPLIVHTIEAVIESKMFDKIIVSSDDDKVIRITCDYDEIQAWNRPKHLATDTATTSQVLLDVLIKLKIKEGICGIFLPTSPFRSSHHIKESMELLTNNIDCVISVSYYSAPIGFRMRYLLQKNGCLKLPNDSPLLKGQTRTQEQQTFVHPNGGIYLSKISSFIKNVSFFHGNIYGYIMKKRESIDIDDREDYKLAQMLFSDLK